MVIKYKKRCSMCNKNFVLVSGRAGFAQCYDCQESEMKGKIDDPEMKKMFDLPEQFYKDNNFLRDIKVTYLKWGNLTPKQIAAFQKTVEGMKKKED